MFSCTQYHRALARLRQRAFSMTAEDVLFSSILFIFFENARGDMDAALKHLYAANSILQEEQKKRAGEQSSSQFLETVLTPMLEQLNISSATSMPAFHDGTPPASIPDTFSSLEEANVCFYSTAQSISAQLDLALESDDFSEAGITARGMLSQWWAALERYRSSPTSSRLPEPYFRLGLLHLDLLHLSSTLRLDVALAPFESTYDFYHAEAQRIIQMSLEIIEMIQKLGQKNDEIKQHLGFTPTCIPTLSYVGSRCRDPILRREAVKVLRMVHRTESQRDSLFVADVTEFVIDLEESWTSDPIRTCADIPESARVQLMHAMCYNFDHNAKKIKPYVCPTYCHRALLSLVLTDIDRYIGRTTS